MDHGSPYPALQRLEQRGAIKGAWGVSDNNRRARFYSLTALGRRVKAVDPAVFAAMSVMMIGVGVLASYLPARRASNVNPIEALRSD